MPSSPKDLPSHTIVPTELFVDSYVSLGQEQDIVSLAPSVKFNWNTAGFTLAALPEWFMRLPKASFSRVALAGEVVGVDAQLGA